MYYRHLFGPVPSRRLGVSLGIDLTPDKSCSFNCIFCECGKTVSLTLERKEYVPTEDVIAELDDYLFSKPELDSITFSGSGDPTLHTGLREIIGFLKRKYPRYRVTILTNGSLLYLPEIREDLSSADLVIPSLNAVTEQTYIEINRPHPQLSLSQHIEGLRVFCDEFCGEKWLEIFIVPGVNDTPEELALFKQEIVRLNVDRVQLNTLDRPAPVSWVTAAPYQHLVEMAHFLGPNVEVIAARKSHRHIKSFDMNVRDIILTMLQVRPSTMADLEKILNMKPIEISMYLDELIHQNLVESKRETRGIFYVSTSVQPAG